MPIYSSNVTAEANDEPGLSRGFPPVAPRAARVLILGSLPGQMSLEKRQYYGQPRNAFWPIMDALCGAGPELEYAGRLRALRASGIALWDVLAAAERPGSLDSAIVAATMRVNDFVRLFRICPEIHALFFNGRKAAQLYERHVLPLLGPSAASLRRITLPSTSPAYAGMPLEAKRLRWQAEVGPYLAGPG